MTSRVKMKAEFTCQECGDVITRTFMRGDYIFKKGELTLPKKLKEYMESLGKKFCNHKDWLIVAIYQDNKEYTKKELELLRRFQTGGQNTW